MSKINEAQMLLQALYDENRCNKCLQRGALDATDLESIKDAIGYIKAYKTLIGFEETELEKCPDCGNTIDKGACFYCKMD